ncbi:hypothetical protein SDC9_152366 [bioreactor metagenome]|uniref:Uncharacterized protein n=1 Tax=bioreactor metagenome TaxID=1076179 RepID=A0A645EUK9_9ZZZZ
MFDIIRCLFVRRIPAFANNCTELSFQIDAVFKHDIGADNAGEGMIGLVGVFQFFAMRVDIGAGGDDPSYIEGGVAFPPARKDKIARYSLPPYIQG